MTEQTVHGVDLSAAPERTAIATIAWGAGAASIERVEVGCDDDAIVDAVRAAPTGIDCAFGWPEPFAEFIRRVDAGEWGGIPTDGGPAWRRTLAYRATDEAVREATGRLPLSVSTDRLGLVAMRLMAIFARLDAMGIRVNRDAEPPTFEVYPAAALRVWGVDARGYKASADKRTTMIEELKRRAAWLDWTGHEAACVATDHAFDAVIAALITRAATLRRFDPPPPGLMTRAAVEGWVVVPNAGLDDRDEWFGRYTQG